MKRRVAVFGLVTHIESVFAEHESSAPMPMAGSLPNTIAACRE